MLCAKLLSPVFLMKFIALDDVLLAFVLLRVGSGINHFTGKRVEYIESADVHPSLTKRGSKKGCSGRCCINTP